jgi:hypothetical protein
MVQLIGTIAPANVPAVDRRAIAHSSVWGDFGSEDTDYGGSNYDRATSN